MRGVHETPLASSTYVLFMWRLPIFMGWNWKCHVIIVIKNDLSGFVVPNACRLVRTVCQIPRANALGIWLPASHTPLCIATTNPSRTCLNPLIKTVQHSQHITTESAGMTCHLSGGDYQSPFLGSDTNVMTAIRQTKMVKLFCHIKV